MSDTQEPIRDDIQRIGDDSHLRPPSERVEDELELEYEGRVVLPPGWKPSESVANEE